MKVLIAIGVVLVAGVLYAAYYLLFKKKETVQQVENQVEEVVKRVDPNIKQP